MDGANLLIRDADMLVTQMNRPCAFGAYTPRGVNGSQDEHPLQAIKRAIERSRRRASGGRSGPPQLGSGLQRLRQDAPVFAIVLSDEEDYTAKYTNNASTSPLRDQNELPPARCYSNPSDDGCNCRLLPRLCFWTASAATELMSKARSDLSSSYKLRIPAARSFSGGVQTVDDNGAYCLAARSSLSTVSNGSRTNGDHYDGFYEDLSRGKTENEQRYGASQRLQRSELRLA